jgi:hypothetical protein
VFKVGHVAVFIGRHLFIVLSQCRET